MRGGHELNGVASVQVARPPRGGEQACPARGTVAEGSAARLDPGPWTRYATDLALHLAAPARPPVDLAAEGGHKAVRFPVLGNGNES